MSKLMLCPICDNFMIDDERKDNKCPHCGFSFDDEEEVKKAYMIYLCPVCGEGCTKHVASQHNYICKYCNNELIRIDIDMHHYMELCEYDETNKEENTKILANKYGNNQFSEEEYHHRLYAIKQEIKQRQTRQHEALKNPPKPQITCPYCNSTNTKKISTASRAGSILGFGILSKKIGKQWHCNNCGSDF